MTHGRIVVAGATVAITRRTTLRKMWWTPSDPVVQQGWLYAMAAAQEKYDVDIHHATLLPTHHHLTATPRKANLPEFLRHHHREAACFLQAYLLEAGYDAPPNVWDARPTHVMRLVGPSAKLAWLLYEHINGVAAGLVEKVEDYPGFVSDFGLMKSGERAVKRPPIYFGKDQPEERLAQLTPSPALLRAFDGDAGAMVYRLRKSATVLEKAHALERERLGRGVVGAAAVRAIHPWSEPRTARERRGERVPIYKLGPCGAEDRRAIDERVMDEWARQRQEGRECFERWRGGDREVVFPFGTYAMRVVHRARVEKGAREDAILCAEGEIDPCLLPAFDLRASLEHLAAAISEDARGLDDLTDLVDGASVPRRAGQESGDGAVDRDAAIDATAVDASGMSLAAPSAVASATGTDGRAPAKAVGLVHPASTASGEHPRRLVTLRTRRDRRGKPRDGPA